MMRHLLPTCARRTLRTTRWSLPIARHRSRPSILVRSLSTALESFGGQYRLLRDEEIVLAEEQRALTERARAVASQVQGVQIHQDTLLEDIIGNEQSTFSIVVAGEFNAGKSMIINALLGTKMLETGALPTTDFITILTHGPTDSTQITNVGGHAGVVIHQVLNVPLLQDLTLVDTPGTNAVVLDHTARTMRLLPSADLILFVTSADRPFPESERAILKSIQAYRKHIVVVLNKMDVLETAGGNYGEEEKRRVVEFVSDHASELLGARPIVIPISARNAISAKLALKDEESDVWKRSTFASLENFLKETLTTETKIKAKLTSPIGIVEGMMTECLNVLDKEKKELSVDIATLNLLRTQFEAWEKEMKAELDSFRRDISLILSNEGARFQKLLGRMSLLDWYMAAFDEALFSLEWKRTKRRGPNAVKRIEEELLDLVAETADSVATSARAQGQAVIEYLGKRHAVKSQSLVGSVTAASKFDDTKNALLEKMSDSVRSVLSEYDEEVELDGLVRSLKQTALLSSVLQLGAAIAALATATSALAIVPGIASSSTLVVAGTAIMNRGTTRMSAQHQDRWNERRRQLDEILDAICSKELEKGVRSKILAGVLPYTRYVGTEKERISRTTEECERVPALAQALRNRISKLHRIRHHHLKGRDR